MGGDGERSVAQGSTVVGPNKQHYGNCGAYRKLQSAVAAGDVGSSFGKANISQRRYPKQVVETAMPSSASHADSGATEADIYHSVGKLDQDALALQRLRRTLFFEAVALVLVTGLVLVQLCRMPIRIVEEWLDKAESVQRIERQRQVERAQELEENQQDDTCMAEDESTFTSFPSLSKANTLSSLTQQDLESLLEMSSKQVV